MGFAAAALDEPAEGLTAIRTDGTLGMSEPPSLSSPDDDILATRRRPQPLNRQLHRLTNLARRTRPSIRAMTWLRPSLWLEASDEKLDQARINKSPDLRAAAEEFYRAFANLGEKATYVRRDGAAEVLSSSRDLLSSLNSTTKATHDCQRHAQLDQE